ncbi:recombinase family protein [Actinomadura sp. DC4]|uniref:recombinase family protein n=1 Tax=Actinomadura sp. DC4 TaxID=3055069 RepID=UPI0025AFFAA2|nr:recombinase family protein [Actinomadura sp. DC4]MDN3356819.1 recombinase family protein [Actinomadura sp. DC4]
MLELSWDGFCEHTEQLEHRPPSIRLPGRKRPHPVPARRAEGKTRTRLVPDPATAPTVTLIFQLRALQRLGYDDIADRLNTDSTAHPPPAPVDPRRAVGRWTRPAVRGVLGNPRYTGHMVWNRRATKKGGRFNPPSERVWSPRPTHEPLVTKELFEAASPVAKYRQGSRTGAGINDHPQAKRSYRLRSYVICDFCDRRMFGKTRRDVAFLACQPQRQHHKGRAPPKINATTARSSSASNSRVNSPGFNGARTTSSTNWRTSKPPATPTPTPSTGRPSNVVSPNSPSPGEPSSPSSTRSRSTHRHPEATPTYSI